MQTMNAAKKARLLAAGYTTGTVAAFLQLPPYAIEIIARRIVLTNRGGKLRTRSYVTNEYGDKSDAEGKDYNERFDAEG